MPSKSSFLKIEKELIQSLLEQSKNGNKVAFEKLSIHIKDISHSYFISKYYSGKLNGKDDADDLTSTVYISFAEQYTDINNIEHWLRRVLFLTFVNWYKKNRKRAEISLDESYHNISAENETNEKFDVEKIISLVNTLPEEKQKIIKLRFWEELKFTEIAEKTSKSEAAVKKMFYRTIEELGRMIE